VLIAQRAVFVLAFVATGDVFAQAADRISGLDRSLTVQLKYSPCKCSTIPVDLADLSPHFGRRI
jgi:hypothetical protein